MLACLGRRLREQIKTAKDEVAVPNTTLKFAPFGRWTLHDKAVQCRLALRS